MNRAATLGLLLAIAAALVLRCSQPDARPMHNDEGVNALKFKTLWEQGVYRYDPDEYHGPTLPYFTLGWMKLIRAPDFAHQTEGRLRFVTVLFGIGLILLLPLVADGLGRRTSIVAAFFTAISPAMVFYSRYYIHEMLLVFFAFAAFACVWRYRRSGNIRWALLAGAAAGLMQSTKETFVLSIAAAGIAWAANEFWNWRIAATGPAQPWRWNFKHVAAAVAVWGVVAVLLFSSFFTNWNGIADAVRTYLPWLHRAQGASPHIHPWSFYLERLAWFHPAKGLTSSELFILVLAVFGLVAVFRSKLPSGSNISFARFIVFYTVILTAIYSVIAYKTPWCLLNFYHGMILLAGVGAVAVVDCFRKRVAKFAVGILLAAGAAQLAAQAWQLSTTTTYSADPRNPYAYAQTSRDALELVAKVNAIAAASPQGKETEVKVMAPESEYGPLPWYLRNFDNGGWWSQIPPEPFAPIMIVSTKFDAQLDRNKTHLMAGLFELRPGAFFELYVETNLWAGYLKTLPPPAPDQ